MIYIRSSIYLICFLPWTLAVAVLGLPSLVSRGGTLWVIRFWAHGVALMARWIIGIRFEIQGKEHLNLGPSIIAAQHQSAFETYMLFLLFKRPVFVLKDALQYIPLVGWYIRRGGLIAIDRGAGASAMRRVLRAADKAISDGETVLIFPEGTRTSPGERQDYKPGIVALYRHCDAPLVPMALNTGYFWGKNRLAKIPGPIIFEFLPPIERGLDRNAFLLALRTSIETAAADLPVPGSAPADNR
jgi:1-acyl-sn-glycerol-3-phosphate acyltransferase